MVLRGKQIVTPKYTYIHNRPPIWRGDTYPAMAIKLTDRDNDDKPIIPEFVCAQIRNEYGALIYNWDVIIEGDRIILDEIPREVTSKFRPGSYLYDIEYRLASGKTYTFFRGSIEIAGDVSRC